ncbi:MAG: rotamase [Alphaproteobacteria bacterium]|nr:rotamase [Alphaproteobacteria bacterium]
MSEAPQSKSNAGIFAILGIVAIAAVAALVYLSGNVPGKPGSNQTTNPAQAASGDESTQEAAAEGQQAAIPEQPKLEIKPGDPVVAVVNGQDIMRSDVFQFIATLPQNVRQLPVDQLYGLAVNQLVNTKLVEARAGKADLSNDPAVREQLDQAKQQIVRNVFLQRQVEERTTEEKLRSLYDAYAAKMGEIPEVKARHILVEDESAAKELIKKAMAGADFAELAKENSTGPSAEQGGDLGWFAQGEMVSEFSEAAFAIEPGQVGDTPVKTQFGWHVIKVEERRMRPAPAFEDVRQMLDTQVRRQVLDNLIDEWREQADVTVYDINGEPISSPDADEAPVGESADPVAVEAPVEEPTPSEPENVAE